MERILRQGYGFGYLVRVNGRDNETGGATSSSGRDNVYRLASVGQDCQLLLHDIVVIAEDYLAGLPPLRLVH
jgi:hypothetical protein